jgi:hypothetical protein
MDEKTSKLVCHLTEIGLGNTFVREFSGWSIDE